MNSINRIKIFPQKWFLPSISLGKNKNRNNIVEKYLLLLEKALEEAINSYSFIFDQVYGARNSYNIYRIKSNRLFYNKKRYNHAEQIFIITTHINKSTDKNIMDMLDLCYINQERFEEAEILY